MTDNGSRPKSSRPLTESTLVFISYTVDLENNDQDIASELKLPYRVTFATRLTEEQIQNLDPETACTLACLRETQYYWKDQKYFFEHGLPDFRGTEPTIGFLDRVKELEFGSTKVTLIDDDVLQFTVPPNAPSECPYRRVLGQETDDLEAKLPDCIKARTLEFGPDCPPIPDNMRRDVDFV
jgi:hypothetical protein